MIDTTPLIHVWLVESPKMRITVDLPANRLDVPFDAVIVSFSDVPDIRYTVRFDDLQGRFVAIALSVKAVNGAHVTALALRGMRFGVVESALNVPSIRTFLKAMLAGQLTLLSGLYVEETPELLFDGDFEQAAPAEVPAEVPTITDADLTDFATIGVS